jgi:hypothetical protein
MLRLRTWLPMLCLSFTAGLALAASVHLKPPHRPPVFSDGGLTLTSSGALAGLGNGDVLVTLTAQADVTATCQNPGSGAHEPPGQNPAPVSVSGAQAIPESEIKNGNTPFSVVTIPPVTPLPGAPDCPNPHWREAITDLAFTSTVLTIEQPVGTVVLTVSCAFSPATSDGVVPAAEVTCETL